MVRLKFLFACSFQDHIYVNCNHIGRKICETLESWSGDPSSIIINSVRKQKFMGNTYKWVTYSLACITASFCGQNMFFFLCVFVCWTVYVICFSVRPWTWNKYSFVWQQVELYAPISHSTLPTNVLTWMMFFFYLGSN